MGWVNGGERSGRRAQRGATSKQQEEEQANGAEMVLLSRSTMLLPRTCGLDFHPPNAVPFQVRPVTSWKGRVAISWPEAATPITTEVPQPRCEHSRAARITCGT
jgi:hypothetical protein